MVAGFLLWRQWRALKALRRSHEALRISEERYRLANYGTNDTTWDVDLVNGALWVNEALVERYGEPKGLKISWQMFTRRVHPEDAQRVEERFHAALKSKENRWSDEFRYRCYDGSWAYVVDRGYITRNAEGRAVRLSGSLTDITRLKKAEQAVDRLRRQNELILNCAGEGIFGVDLDGKATFVNPAAAKMLGWSREELVGEEVYELVHTLNADGTAHDRETCPARRALAEGTIGASDEEVFWRRDGSQLPVDYISNPILDEHGHVNGAVVTFRDVTERRAVERMKSEFVATVSHELRTPLTSIRGALGLLGSGLLGQLTEKPRRMLAIAIDNADRLARLINDILDLERIENSRMALVRRPCDTGELVMLAVETLRPMAEKAHITLYVDAPSLPLWADADRIVQTLTNLVGNAIKFSPTDGMVRVMAAEGPAHVTFSVEDQGRGIPHEHHEFIFDRFHQVNASDSRDKGGTGLGLAICRAIVQQHGGTIWVESAVGNGSKFSFTIPRPAKPVEEPLLAAADGARW